MAVRTTPQPWTPAEVIRRLAAIYGQVTWRPHGDPMTELVLTVLSQHTSDANSGRAFLRLRAAFPTWESLLAAPEHEVAACIQVGGLARQKAPRLKQLLMEVAARDGSFDLVHLSQRPLEEARAWLRSLPGVGPKTAACVLLFALGQPALPVDTHVHRVARRLGLIPAKAGAEQAHELLEAMLKPEQVYPFHVMLIKHGRQLCRAQRPLCGECPLLRRCPAGPRFLAMGLAAAAS